MNLTPVVARITAECPSFKLVGGAADFGGIEGVPRATPACFILPLAESGEADEGLDEPDFVQRVRAEFGVVVAVTNVASRAGAEGAAALEDLRAELAAALFGWTPGGSLLPLVYVRGDLVEFRPGLLWWQDTWRGAYEIETV